ncbi:cation diffusion facilitator family transporter [Stappia sp. GBMRC 2046]|uniref:Protein p34 n=1 Tax=Stappia sediminis TaxID=2692190 RepID=A0A7X3S7R1_9HYPH|nr:cation diffusion facilitator family transporter [Stappia sediminis]MXN65056.1 cation diffusion facilitator family transporter [Stappia sediminis]
MEVRLRIAFGSVVVGIVVLALKYVAYHLTGSVALYSDALESVVNVASAIAALGAVWYASKPADSNHPYGHHKVEYFAAVFVGVMIVLAALSIAREAWFAFNAQKPVDFTIEALAVNGGASLINAAWAYVLIRHGRKARSLALVADGKHLVTDVVSSLGVLAGVALVFLTGWLTLDPLLGALVALNILWSGWQLVKESIGGLMDEAASQEVQDKIRDIISAAGEGALEAHDLRTRPAGRVTFIDFHLVVPAEMTVVDAHDICDRIEAAIGEEVAGAKTTIHVEPEQKAKHSGIVVL